MITKQQARLLRIMSEAIGALNQVADDARATPGETYVMKVAEGMAAEMKDLRHMLRGDYERRAVSLSMFAANEQSPLMEVPHA